MKGKAITGLALLVGTMGLYAQQIPKTELDIEAFIEERFAFQEEDIPYEDLYESLLQHYFQPLDLQKATSTDLQSLYLLSPKQIESFINYRNQLGNFVSLYELQAIPDWTLTTIENLLPFVVINSSNPHQSLPGFKRMAKAENAYLLLRHNRVWQERKGFSVPDTLANGTLSSRYMGDPNNLYLRFRLQQPSDFSMGLTLDKDAGELFTWDPQTKRYGFNFLSFHYTLYNKGRLKMLSLGDYQLQYGQGLVFGSGFSVGKGAETITTVKRSSIGVRPYTSVLEAGYFRGLAATYSMGRLDMTFMLSNKSRDANIQTTIDSLDNSSSYLSSLVLSGLHRTKNEIQKKAQANEQNLGVNLGYQNFDKTLKVGVNSLYTGYSQPIYPTERVYNQFEFKGKSNTVHSIYFTYNFRNHYFFGETALSKSGGMGHVAGFMSSLNSKLDFSLVWRKYDRNFHTFYGNAFSEGSRPINEEGLYMGVYFKPNRKFSWSAYYDYFSFPWMRFRVYAPSIGHEWLSRFKFQPNKQLTLFIQFREEIKSRNLLSEDQPSSQYLLAQGKRQNMVWSLNYHPNRSWQIKSRVQQSFYKFAGEKSKGFLIAQSISGEAGAWKFSGSLALFDTDDYENRQYLYEKNVLWAFSIPNFYDQGIRTYLLVQYKVNPRLTIWGRWAKTNYTNREQIGSGLQEIAGNKMVETTFQLRYQFNR
ncbi:ComEA family DNA-binding protein [Cyclobacterium marinum]|uniref:ComEA family DNA-binding protein n=1 Tax=Cyclobacterium marinum TaxID=104 RepID=UPI0011F0622B|nr:helix-hairpin-helix domain-containing protein [Cyclobacterium marinum]MBI0399020.1 helix-hairpin-helix domain-containing protein [Cyclobacterium marinum]